MAAAFKIAFPSRNWVAVRASCAVVRREILFRPWCPSVYSRVESFGQISGSAARWARLYIKVSHPRTD